MFAAKNVKQGRFMSNFHYIFFFGALGTIFTFVCLFSFIFVLAQPLGFFPQLSESDCKTYSKQGFFLAASLTATDTVSVLSILKEDEYPKLHTIIFGEGIINDAVALLLFKTVFLLIQGGLGENAFFSFNGITGLLLSFALLTLKSILIGCIAAFLLSLLVF